MIGETGRIYLDSWFASSGLQGVDRKWRSFGTSTVALGIRIEKTDVRL